MWSQGVNMKIFLEILRLQGSPDLGGITIILSLGISDVCESTWRKMESKVESEFIRVFHSESMWHYTKSLQSANERLVGLTSTRAVPWMPHRREGFKRKALLLLSPPINFTEDEALYQHTSTPTHVLVSLGRQRFSFCSGIVWPRFLYPVSKRDSYCRDYDLPNFTWISFGNLDKWRQTASWN